MSQQHLRSMRASDENAKPVEQRADGFDSIWRTSQVRPEKGKDSRRLRGAVVCGPSRGYRYRLMITNASMLASTVSVAATPGGRWAPKKSEAAPLKTTPVHSVVA
jgi:hypothetical protein